MRYKYNFNYLFWGVLVAFNKVYCVFTYVNNIQSTTQLQM